MEPIQPTRRPASHSRLVIPTSAHGESFDVRSYEVGANGRVGMGTLIRFMEHLATQDSEQRGFDHHWYQAHGSAWVVREFTIQFGALPSLADHIASATWISGYRRVQAWREYALWHAASSRVVARAQARWAYIHTAAGQPTRIPDAILHAFTPADSMLRQRKAPVEPDLASAPSSRVRLVARTTEADSQQHINHSIYVDWLTDAFFEHTRLLTREESSLPLVDAVLRPRACHIEYVRSARPGDHVVIQTQSARVGSRGLRVAQRIWQEGDESSVFAQATSEYLLCPSASSSVQSQSLQP